MSVSVTITELWTPCYVVFAVAVKWYVYYEMWFILHCFILKSSWCFLVVSSFFVNHSYATNHSDISHLTHTCSAPSISSEFLWGRYLWLLLLTWFNFNPSMAWRSILKCNNSTSADTLLEGTPMFAHVTLHRTVNPLGRKCPWWQDEEAAS